MMGHVNASVDNIERPLLTPDEVQRLKAPRKKGSGEKERIVAPGQMLIFFSGQYPILGTQMLYLFDPVLKMRSEIRPPEKFPSLQKKRAWLPAAETGETTPPIAPQQQESNGRSRRITSALSSQAWESGWGKPRDSRKRLPPFAKHRRN